MIGRYYDAWGSKQNIMHRYGDGHGNPFQGPVQLSYFTNTRLFVLCKNQVITLQNTMGGIECHLCPLEEQERFEDDLFQLESNDENWAKKFLASSNSDHHQPSSSTSLNNRLKVYTVFLDIMPIRISCIMNHEDLFILDERNLIKVYDSSQRNIRNTFGKSGKDPGEFSTPTTIHAFRIGNQCFVLVGDAGANQKLHLFTAEGEYLTSIGGKGPMLGQFRDISSVSTYVSNHLLDTSIDFFHNEYLPSWYVGKEYKDDEDLQDLLVSDSQINNFVVAKDLKGKEENLHYVHFFNRDKSMSKLPIRYGEVVIKQKQAPPTIDPLESMMKPSSVKLKPNSKVTFPPTSSSIKAAKSPSTTLNSKKKDSNAKAEPLPSQEETIIRKTGYYLVEPERFDDGGEGMRVYPSLYDLVKYRKDLFSLREEKRDHYHVAVCDRKNFRVQIMKGYWSKSTVYSPLLIPLEEIGGNKNRRCLLQDPVDVCYSKGGELAICDNGRNQIVLLSPILEVIKVIQPIFLSIKDLQSQQQAEDNESKDGTEDGDRGAADHTIVKKIEVSAINEINNQFNGKTNDKGGEEEKSASKEKAIVLNLLDKENSKKPCSIAFNSNGNMAIGFKSGGVYIYQKNLTSSMGILEKLQIRSMEKIILEYLSYPEIELLRGTCVYLHNFTRELRLTYRIFPLYRQKQYNKLIYFFFKTARIGREGLPQLASHELKDMYNQLICPYHLQLLCPLKPEACNYSHERIFLHRKEVNSTNAYLCYEELLYLISNLFHPKFLWKNEIFIKELFYAFSYEETIVVRQGALNRPSNPYRDKVPVTTRVINFLSYLEIMVLLEEHLHRYKLLTAHKLFCPTAMTRFIPKVPTNIESIDHPVPYVNPFEQYSKGGINIPPNRHLQGKRIISKKGYENAERKEEDERKEHVAAYHFHTERATTLIDKLFS